MLLATADIQPHWEFIGQDLRLRRVRLAGMNLGLQYRYGYVIWGNALRLEKPLVYRTGFNLRGVIREIRVKECPAPVQHAAFELLSTSKPPSMDDGDAVNRDAAPAKRGKERLF